MSINIPAETPDESTNPISVEEFERLHPAMLGAIRKAVREEKVYNSSFSQSREICHSSGVSASRLRFMSLLAASSCGGRSSNLGSTRSSVIWFWRSRYSSGVPSSSSSLLYEASITALGSASINSHVFKNASSGMDGFALIHLEYPPLECPRISATFVCEMECFANSPFSSSPTSCAKRRLRYSLLSLM